MVALSLPVVVFAAGSHPRACQARVFPVVRRWRSADESFHRTLSFRGRVALLIDTLGITDTASAIADKKGQYGSLPMRIVLPKPPCRSLPPVASII